MAVTVVAHCLFHALQENTRHQSLGVGLALSENTAIKRDWRGKAVQAIAQLNLDSIAQLVQQLHRLVSLVRPFSLVLVVPLFLHHVVSVTLVTQVVVINVSLVPPLLRSVHYHVHRVKWVLTLQRMAPLLAKHVQVERLQLKSVPRHAYHAQQHPASTVLLIQQLLQVLRALHYAPVLVVLLGMVFVVDSKR
jgi:hypothetical protein